MNCALQKISDVLIEIEDDQQKFPNFYACDELVPEDIAIEFKDFGHLTFPLTYESIEQLIKISSKAKFGLREQTILDNNVRNTQELKPDQFQVTGGESSILQMLNKMRDQLGLPENSVLIPHLHNMLIYGPGQFFDKHQDTEKLENMIATLVIVLPSPHIGGDLIIGHGQTDYTFSTENVGSRSIKCIAFYSDCMHNVEKVKDGYRVALTYNLVLKSGTPFNMETTNEQLKNAVAEYFVTKTTNRMKLVYFLNHTYTEHGLNWYMLKGEDRSTVSAIKNVAKELGLVINLALVQIEQTYATCGSPYDSEPELDECLEESSVLSYWIDKENKKNPLGDCQVENDEICWTIETNEFEPLKKKFTGYQGNWGNNMDFWYRRAAVVLWPESNQICSNFKLNYDSALTDLFTLTNIPGNEEQVLEIINKAGLYLFKYYNLEPKKNYFDKFVSVAIYVKDEAVAKSVLSYFTWKILDSDIVESLVKLQMQYSLKWCIELLKSWTDGSSLLCNIDTFVRNFLHHRGGEQVLELLLDTQCKNLINSDNQTSKTPLHLKNTLPSRMEMLHKLFTACAALRNVDVLYKMITHVVSKTNLYPVLSLAELFLKLQENIQYAEFLPHYATLKSYLITVIDSKLTLPVPDENDWSINTQLSCDCKHCHIANRFLRSKTHIRFVWPIVDAVRKHIMHKFGSLRLPVDITVERTGSPHKLVMVKNALFHANMLKVYRELKFYQEKLQSNVNEI